MLSCFPMIFRMEGWARCRWTSRREIWGRFSETSPLITFGIWLCIAPISTPDTTLWLAYSVLGSKPRFKSVLFFRLLALFRDTFPILVWSSLNRTQALMASVSTPPSHVWLLCSVRIQSPEVHLGSVFPFLFSYRELTSVFSFFSLFD